jgi:DNA-binding CsgD family transcriptional regulator
VGTVKSHTGNIYRKLGARNRAEALNRARELGLIQ